MVVCAEAFSVQGGVFTRILGCFLDTNKHYFHFWSRVELLQLYSSQLYLLLFPSSCSITFLSQVYNVLLSGGACQPVPKTKRHNDTTPDVVADQLEMFLHCSPVGSVHMDHQQEDMRPRRTERQTKHHLPLIKDGGLFTEVFHPPAWCVHHSHRSPKHYSFSNQALGCCAEQLACLPAQDWV